MEQLKKCVKCKIDKSSDNFSLTKNKQGTVYSRRACKECNSKLALTWHYNNKERSLANNKRYRLYRMGLSQDDYDLMLQEQDFKCAICGDELLGKANFPPVDHCHKTGKVRGILCINCNHLLGKAKDNIQTLQAAIAYLQKDEI